MKADLDEKTVILESDDVTKFLEILDFNIIYFRKAIRCVRSEDYKNQLIRSEKMYEDLMDILGKKWREKTKISG